MPKICLILISSSSLRLMLTSKMYGAILSQKIHGKVIVIPHASEKIKPVMIKDSRFKLEFQTMHSPITKMVRGYLISSKVS